MPKLKYSDELKKAVHYVLDKYFMLQAAKEFYVKRQIVQRWIDFYGAHGVNDIRNSIITTNNW